MKNDHLDVDRLQAELLAAIEPHVPFDGWSEPAFKAAVADLGVDPGLARVVCPRGAVDLAVAYHRAGDRAMEAAIAAGDFTGFKFRDKIAAAVQMRLEVADREMVRRGAALFALPQHAATGSKLIWETSDRIWRALGDSSEDFNWYTKRLTLSGVYSATVLFWLGDESEDHRETREFLDHRIENVMQFEKVKGKVMGLPLVKDFLGALRAPTAPDLPGRTGGDK
ncbi:COQ9 family protein [Sinirhodobacter sp. WL0062]|uniref:COQ9 family protein n=1 Tax=Rhodobacter flavimaris TaxID=2907145 RepID=A0ABS8YYD2_9RHOB|nr:COQ9 family protein [Sinirhodobacter sp. WL0062]MCE5973504.1 COQ9 family protein [Sinirhodobacter sp. WL0062]